MSLSPETSNAIVNIPYWMQLFAFIAGFLFTILTIIGIITHFARKGILEFRLTREVFFRITDFEEAIFANGVLFAKNEGILINAVEFKLNKIDAPTKSFNLRAAYFGEKVRGVSPFSDFNFYTTSPIAYIPVFMPQRIVYYLAQESYEKEIKKEFTKFKTTIQTEHQKIRDSAPSVDPTQKDKKTMEFVNAINTIHKEYVGQIMELIQLESGQYELQADISYITKKLIFFKTKKKCSSKIAFKIENNVKDILRAQLFLTLQNISQNIILAGTNPVKFPEYSPIETKEIL